MTFNPAQGDGAQLMDIMQMQAALNGFTLVDSSEAAVTPGATALTVDVGDAPSGVRLGGPAESFGGAVGVALPTPDTTYPRKALVYIDSTGSVQVAAGTPDSVSPSGAVRQQTSTPAVPVPTESFLPLAEVWIPADAADISQDDISSRRMPFEQGQGSGLNADLVRGKNPTPSGIIAMWSGAISDVPNGWTLCDGTDGAPDLQDRFVVGAGSQYAVGGTGGEEQHTLTVDEMPSHAHSYKNSASGSNYNQTDTPDNSVFGENITNKTTGSTGGDQPHENRPPYFAVAYIMKL